MKYLQKSFSVAFSIPVEDWERIFGKEDRAMPCKGKKKGKRKGKKKSK